MEVQELVDGQPAVVEDLDELDVDEEEDEATEELRQQRGFEEDLDYNNDETGIELLDHDRQPMTRRHKNNISNLQQGDHKRISTVFKF